MIYIYIYVYAYLYVYRYITSKIVETGESDNTILVEAVITNY